jgi:hypothetical protein
MKLRIALSGKREDDIDDFMDRHPPNTHGEDLLDFIEYVKTRLHIHVKNDVKDPPLNIIRNAANGEIVAWYDDEDEQGYRPK